MTRLSWGDPGERRYESGVDRGVLYVATTVPWNGLTAVNQASDGGEVVPRYIDGVKYRNRVTAEEFTGTLEAFTYPDEFEQCDGTAIFEEVFDVHQQERREFGLSYRTKLGNDIQGLDYGYKIHLIYNALATPSSKDFSTLNETPDPGTFSWDITTRPIPIPGLRYSSHITINSTKMDPLIMELIENELYGTDIINGSLVTPQRLATIYQNAIEEVLIEPNAITGLAILVDEEEDPDLRGLADTGIFRSTTGSRLDPTATPGLYQLGS
jgi:hypothetical protein